MRERKAHPHELQVVPVSSIGLPEIGDQLGERKIPAWWDQMSRSYRYRTNVVIGCLK